MAYAHAHVSMCMYVCVSACRHVYACGGQRSVSDVVLYCFLPYFLRQSLLLNLELVDSARLSGQ